MEQIWLATDLGDEAVAPWAHALRIAAAAGEDLHVVHTHQGESTPSWTRLPTARELLVRWGFLPADATVEDFSALEFKIHMRALEANHPAGLLGALIEVKAPDLVILGTHRPSGLKRLFEGSVGEEIARHAPGAALVCPDGARPIVQPADGGVRLRRVVIPVADASASGGLTAALDFVGALDAWPVEFVFVHVGDEGDMPELDVPDRPGWTFRTVNYPSGPVVGRILEAATDNDADLIAMATHGHDSWGDVVFGSRTERVIRDSPVPVLMTRIRD